MPAKAMYSQGSLRLIVGNLHVGTADYAVARNIAKRSKSWTGDVETPGGAMISGRRARLSAIRCAVGIHRLNRGVYLDVMSGQLHRKPSAPRI